MAIAVTSLILKALVGAAQRTMHVRLSCPKRFGRSQAGGAQSGVEAGHHPDADRRRTEEAGAK
jgi:hypothetical protein